MSSISRLMEHYFDVYARYKRDDDYEDEYIAAVKSLQDGVIAYVQEQHLKNLSQDFYTIRTNNPLLDVCITHIRSILNNEPHLKERCRPNWPIQKTPVVQTKAPLTEQQIQKSFKAIDAQLSLDDDL
ncbi:MAG: hypothetical protein ACI4WT_09225 [Oligosphaeraceae bacterium]